MRLHQAGNFRKNNDRNLKERVFFRKGTMKKENEKLVN